MVVELGPDISQASNARVRHLDSAIKAMCWPELVDTVPSYRSLLIYYDTALISFDQLAAKVVPLCDGGDALNKRSRRWRLPVRYGGECIDDLNELARKVGMEAEEVVATHSSVEYMVFMVGFSPGFAYLGELPRALEVPRKLVPARVVPANSIQVGGAQTAVSSMPMPSGWYIIGRTPVRMYDPARAEPFLLEGGDRVSFVAVSQTAFDEALAAAEHGELHADWEWTA
jgi:KipI family sensor histidine kinase inhibitor